jgi:hypothetical protein
MLDNADLLRMCFPGQRANVERVAELLAENPLLTSPRIADMTGIPERTVIRHRKTLGLNAPRGGASHGDKPARKPVRKPRTKVHEGWDSRDEQALLARARAGVFAKDLAIEFRCHLSTVSRICHANDVPMAHAPHGPQSGGGGNREKILAYLTADPQATTKEVMAALGLSQGCVQNHRHALGLSASRNSKALPKAVGPKVKGRHFLCDTCSREFELDAHPVFCENGAACVIRLTR